MYSNNFVCQSGVWEKEKVGQPVDNTAIVSMCCLLQGLVKWEGGSVTYVKIAFLVKVLQEKRKNGPLSVTCLEWDKKAFFYFMFSFQIGL